MRAIDEIVKLHRDLIALQKRAAEAFCNISNSEPSISTFNKSICFRPSSDMKSSNERTGIEIVSGLSSSEPRTIEGQ